ncbi:hypothetical protein [Phenylobacterium sp.]|nr:hypothetical protein [Phenylobacterium sp.]
MFPLFFAGFGLTVGRRADTESALLTVDLGEACGVAKVPSPMSGVPALHD